VPPPVWAPQMGCTRTRCLGYLDEIDVPLTHTMLCVYIEGVAFQKDGWR
jgi:hypothetical protein